MFNGPVAAREACEGALAAFPLSLVNAIATGIDFDQLPVPPDPVVEALIRHPAPAQGRETSQGNNVADTGDIGLAN